MLAVVVRSAILLAALSLPVLNAFAQRQTPERPTGPLTLYGDLKVNDANADESRPLSYTVLLYSDGGMLVSRLNVANGGRYRFLNLPPAVYDLAVEVDNVEVARVRVELLSARVGDMRQDLELEWRRPVAANPAKVINASSVYKRSSSNQDLFARADAAAAKKNYEEAAALFRRIVEADPADFPAWTELGTMSYAMGKAEEAEDAYVRALKQKPDFVPAAINLGRLRIAMKKFEPAIEALTVAVEKNPQSADANFLLGEAYLQIKKGSKAVAYLNEAARLGRADAHLRLATLFNAVGMKDKAALEYEEFLKKRPDYKDRKTLEQYISQNKKL